MESAPQGTFRELAAGSRIGKYVLIRRLARGGMAEVYLARESATAGVERLVALKLILPQMAGEERFLSMFLNEARLAATLDHPNIAQVLDVGNVQGEPYLVMEYVHGRTVQSVLRKVGEREEAIPMGCAIELVSRACAGLHFAHERCDLSGEPLHIVHRDVSPSNLMVRYDGTVKLLDFGIAKAASQTTATATGIFKGKVGYMSPEQCADEPLDRRSDVFNLGILLYELTTARRAFFGDNPVAVINKVANARFEPPTELVEGYPPALEAIVTRALSLDPENRFPDAQSMQRALERFARAVRLDVSSVAVAGLMEELYGEQPYPSIVAMRVEEPISQDGDGEFVTGTGSGAITVPAHRIAGVSRPGVSIAIGLGAVLGVGAIWAAVDGDPTPVAKETPAAVAPVEAAASKAETPRDPTPEPPPAELEPEAPPEPEPAKATPAPKPVTKKRRKKRPGTSAKKAPPKRKGPKGMYP
ncbi:MAG: serine/threonine-protein kinase [Myxococcota bacterium]